MEPRRGKENPHHSPNKVWQKKPPRGGIETKFVNHCHQLLRQQYQLADGDSCYWYAQARHGFTEGWVGLRPGLITRTGWWHENLCLCSVDPLPLLRHPSGPPRRMIAPPSPLLHQHLLRAFVWTHGFGWVMMLSFVLRCWIFVDWFLWERMNMKQPPVSRRFEKVAGEGQASQQPNQHSDDLVTTDF